MLEGLLYERIGCSSDSAEVRLLADSPIYRAHFPGYPVTPGVTLIQMALELTGRSLTGARDIRFLAPVQPSQEGTVLRFRWQEKLPGTLDVQVYSADTLCAKMTLSV